MRPLKLQLTRQILSEGPMPFATFMDACLYDRLHGYYASGRARIGKNGDFITAVSTGAVFGKLLARQIARMWEKLGKPSAWTLVEQGAYDGRLCRDILESLGEFAPECLAATTVHIVEPFSPLQNSQAVTLAPFSPSVTWHRSLSSVPEFCGVHYSNELLDAFPFHRVRSTGAGWEEMLVGSDGESLFWTSGPPSNRALSEALCDIPVAGRGFEFEVCLEHKGWLSAVHRRMAQGWLLSFDYGMSRMDLLAPHRAEGTAASYLAHRRQESLLDNPGEADLTAHVDFTAVARASREAGWEMSGFTEQHRFFTGLIPLHFRDSDTPPGREAQREMLALNTLMHPQLMGVQFKALCLNKKSPHPLEGFTYGRDPAFLLEETDAYTR